MCGSKSKTTVAAGMRSFDAPSCRRRSAEADLLRWSRAQRAIRAVHGILVQLPLPAHIDAQKVIAAIDPAKDVDGFHPVNAGRLATGLPALVPCTPLGCIILAKSVQPSLAGLEAVVIGRSNIVGKPLAQLLLGRECDGDDRPFEDRGPAGGVPPRRSPVRRRRPPGDGAQGDWIKPGATVIDVGINRVAVPARAASQGSSATWPSPKRPKSPARSRRCPAASAR